MCSPCRGSNRPHSLNTLPSASLPALLALLSTGQACPTSRPIYAHTISLSGPFLPRPVHDSFLSTSMCGPNATSLLKPPPPRTHSSQQQSHTAPPTSPQLHCFLRRTQSHLPPVFYFSMFYIVLGFQLEFRGLVLLSHSCVPGACGNSQWTAGVQCIQWLGVWSQLCAALTCWVCLVVATVVHLSAGENTEPRGVPA